MVTREDAIRLAKETGQNVSWAEGYHASPDGKTWVTHTSGYRMRKKTDMTPEEIAEMEEILARC